MAKIYFTVGPSQIYPTLIKHLKSAQKEHILSLNHRGEGFKKLFLEIRKNLKKLLDIPQNYHIFFLSSSLETMERTIQNCCDKYSLHIITGAFGNSWATQASQLGKNVIKVESKKGEGIMPSNLEIPKRVELVCITQNDTSTGIWIDPQEILDLKRRYPEKLIAVDLVSSVPKVKLDYKYIDIAFFSVQKGFGLPAGLAPVIISPQAMAKAEALYSRGANIGSYHSFKSLLKKAEEYQTPETPNVLNIYLLNKVIKDLLKIGLKKIREETDKKAKVLYRFFDNHKNFAPFVKKEIFRSPTTLVFDVKGQSAKLRRKLEGAGFIVGAGYGDNKLNHLRIANFPAHKLKDVKRMLKYL